MPPRTRQDNALRLPQPPPATTTDLLLLSSPRALSDHVPAQASTLASTVFFAPDWPAASPFDAVSYASPDDFESMKALESAVDDTGLHERKRKASSVVSVGSATPQSPPDSKKRTLATGSLSNEEKQAKNRLFVKRCYYKKRELLKTMREEVAQLETQFADVFGSWQEQNADAPAAFQRGERLITLRDLYAELTLVRGALLEEQQQLKLRLAERFHFRQRLLQLYEPAT